MAWPRKIYEHFKYRKLTGKVYNAIGFWVKEISIN